MIDTDQLRTYRKKTLFTSWDGEVAESALESTREVFREFLDALLALGADPPIEAVEAAFVECISRLNELDAEKEPFILTIEREDLCDELCAVGEICGVADAVEDWIEDRDW